MTYRISLLFVVLSFWTSAQDSTYLDSTSTLFDTLLVNSNMSFTVPEGMTEIAPIENRQMNYERAFKHSDKRFEVRYAIRPNEFNFPKQMFEMTVLNISGGLLPDYTPFDSEAVKEEFGADSGATVLVESGEEFGQDYAYCLLVYIHKNGVGDGYMFYMADDPTIIAPMMDPMFHALKFNE